jgi:hypothetical protein
LTSCSGQGAWDDHQAGAVQGLDHEQGGIPTGSVGTVVVDLGQNLVLGPQV